jgi:hypothetical protein
MGRQQRTVVRILCIPPYAGRWSGSSASFLTAICHQVFSATAELAKDNGALLFLDEGRKRARKRVEDG